MNTCKYKKPYTGEIVFSLVMATYNRKQEVDDFISSLLRQSFDIKKVELIIVDQNEQNILEDIVNKYSETINILHIRSNIIGASVSRNIGIEASSGEIVAFPDDDCQYYSDTLESVYRVFSGNGEVNTVLGQVFDRKVSEKIIRDWPDKVAMINERNFFFLYTCITVFTKNKVVTFDRNFGPNALFPAYEDADYILSLIKSTNDIICYFPEVQVTHPKLSIDTMSIKKIQDYGAGFGAFCRKNMSIYVFFLYSGILSYHFLRLLLAVAMLDQSAIKKRYYSITSRIKGACYSSCSTATP
jgi:glycosyltransferase involved in cell wall biosynthesis